MGIREVRGCVKYLAIAGAALALCLGVTGAGVAQTGRPVQVAVSAGVILPTGDLVENADPGYRLGADVIVQLGSSPVALRAGAAYDRLAHAHEHQDGAEDGGYRQVAGTLDVLYQLPGLIAMPYLLAGVGVFDLDQPADHGSGESRTGAGFNLGVGIDFPVAGRIAFLEARWQHASIAGETSRFLPLTLGFRF